MKIARDFFTKNTLEVAKSLIGVEMKIINNIQENSNINNSYIITEVEAYLGTEDEASHGFKCKTKRNQAMFLEGGHCYVYLIYGLYYCMNIVTEKEGEASAILIRSLYNLNEKRFIKGPGKICQELKIDFSHNGIDFFKENSNISFYLSKNYSSIQKDAVEVGLRTGISKNIDKLWKFYLKKGFEL